MVHGFISGGSVDITARLLAAHMTEAFGQQVIVDGRPGAGGDHRRFHRRRAILRLHAVSHGIRTCDVARPLSRAALQIRSKTLRWSRWSRAIRWWCSRIRDLRQRRCRNSCSGESRARPDQLRLGRHRQRHAPRRGTLSSAHRCTLNHVPYKGGNAGPVALLANEIPLLFTTAGGSTAYVDSGRLRALAVTTQKRFMLWPDVPTIAETVSPGFDVLAWYAVAGPRNMPAALVDKLNATVSGILKRPDVTEKMLMLGAETRTTTPRAAQDFWLPKSRAGRRLSARKKSRRRIKCISRV